MSRITQQPKIEHAALPLAIPEEFAKQHETMADFTRSVAVVIGINDYQNGIYPLTTAVNDATRLAELLEQEHGYEVLRPIENLTKGQIEAHFADLQSRLSSDDRLLFYFAGHGSALDGDDGPQGFLVPQDAKLTARDSLLPMTDLHGWLDALPCRHMLAILDCCFAGSFRWASTRTFGVLPDVIHQERYDRYLRSRAWQVLTSAAYDQTALDIVAGRAVGSRGIREVDGKSHSPFALALYDALQGEGDLIPKGDGDGVITATELYLYLRQQVEVGVEEAVGHEQTPGLWPLNKHERGEFIFLTPGHVLNLPPADPLTAKNNPYRGLKSYEARHRKFFFGRDEEIDELAALVSERTFTAVLGASGTGKSSLVKAGLLPVLEESEDYYPLPPLRPTEQPIQALDSLLREELGQGLAGSSPDALVQCIAYWAESHPQQRLVLTIDQFEELVTLCRDDTEREWFLNLLATAIRQQPDSFRLIITLRTDFEPQFDTETPFASFWQGARYVVPPMSHDDLRQVIEGPASVQVLYFDPPVLVDELVEEVIQTPGALPLLSFTLSEMYIQYLERQSAAQAHDEMIERSLTQADYDDLGGVIGSLRKRASQEFEALPDKAKDTMRKVMLRMVSVEGGELARRRVHRSELIYPTDEENQRVDLVLQRLVDARLMVTDGEGDLATVEPAHDALVRAWDKLLVWKRAAEPYLPLQRRLAQAANEWAGAGPGAKSGLLWDSDPRLPQLEETLWPTDVGRKGIRYRMRWAKQVLLPNTSTPANTKWLNRSEVAFVQASVTERAKFWRRTLGVAISFIIVLIVATGLSLWLQKRAVNAESIAVAEATRAINAEGTAVAEASRALNAEGTAVAEATRALNAEATAVANEKIAKDREEDALYSARQASANRFASLSQVAILDETDQTGNLPLLLAIKAVTTTLATDDYFTNSADLSLRQAIHNAQPEQYYAFQPEANTEIVAWHPDDVTLAIGSGADIIIWDIEHDREHFRLESPDDRITSLAWNDNGTLLAASYARMDDVGSEFTDPTIRIWDLAMQEERTSFAGNGDLITDIHWHPSQSLLAGSDNDGTTHVWNVDTGAELNLLTGHASAANTVKWSPDGRFLASASDTVRVWDFGTLREVHNFEGHRDVINDLAWSPGSQLIASVSGDPFSDIVESNGNGDFTIRLWSLEGGNLVRQLTGHTAPIHSISWSPDGSRLLTGAGNKEQFADRNAVEDLTARVWGVQTGEELIRFNGHQDPVLFAEWSSDGKQVLSYGGDPYMPWIESGQGGRYFEKEIKVWNPSRYEPLILEVEKGDNWVWTHLLQLRWSNANTVEAILETRLGDIFFYTWELSAGVRTTQRKILGSDLPANVTDPFSINTLFSSSVEENEEMTEDTVARILDSLKRHRSVSPEQDKIAGIQDTVIKLYDARSGIETGMLIGHEASINGVSWSPDSRRLVSVSGVVDTTDGTSENESSLPDATIRIWDTTRGEEISQLGDHNEALTAVAWFGSTIAAGDEHGMLYMYDVRDGRLLHTIAAHRDAITDIAWSPNGKLLVSAGHDQNVSTWDVNTWEKHRSWDYPSEVYLLAWSPDGKRLATGADDDEIRVWEVELEDSLAIAHQLVTRESPELTDEELDQFNLDNLNSEIEKR